ncbi:hypothetical protein SAMN05444383_11992, partial [Myxococcus xanthus]
LQKLMRRVHAYLHARNAQRRASPILRKVHLRRAA